MKESMYNIWMEGDNGAKLCYNAFASGFAELDKETYKFFMKCASKKIDPNNFTDKEKESYEQFKKGGMLVEETLNEQDRVKLKFLQSTYSPNSLGYTLLPTMACNFKCTYCFEEQKPVSMSREVIDKIKEMTTEAFKSSYLEYFAITWFGGEPLLGYDTVIELSDFFINLCNERKVKYSSHMISNCWLLDKEKAKALSERKVTHIQATIDGPPDIHNQRRVLRGGGPTFDRIVQNVLEASEFIPIAVRVNVDKEIAKDFTPLFDSIKILAGKKNISIYPGLLTSEATKACASVENMCLNVQEYAEVLTKFYQSAIEKNLGFSWYVRSMSSSCCATRPTSTVICPDGSLVRCWNQVGQEKESYGNIMDMKAINGENYFKWVLFNPFDKEECDGCVFMPCCLANCPAKWLPMTTDFTQTDRKLEKCASYKYNIKDLLKITYAEKKKEAQKKQEEEKAAQKA
ncbi:MAG TPA: radical SAM protein [Caldisericia bacterium]|nr:radical SAM protein [Caldisericia bacterium]HNY60583.1 radical SAM protein [Caldisericia bacterium]HOC79291.1 radical SAM protein [Caldisericia bacterium]HOG70977.1 radical SAM protein [Caldisericia bacterium]HPA65059.1 radical SAM protein [Caldisericia bacterium]